MTMATEAHNQVVLPRRACEQPSPAIVDGGDSGACVLGGILGVSVPEAYKLTENHPETLNRYKLCAIVERMQWAGLFKHTITDVPLWPSEFFGFSGTYGFPSWDQSVPWYHYVRMACEGGYYGICAVDPDGKGRQDSDQVAMICGARECWTPHKASSGHRIDYEVLVSGTFSKLPEEKWLPVPTFLKLHGGFNVVLVKPS